jgi:hypothetical protein
LIKNEISNIFLTFYLTSCTSTLTHSFIHSFCYVYIWLGFGILRFGLQAYRADLQRNRERERGRKSSTK